MKNGWVLLHKKIMTHRMWKEAPQMLRVFLTLLLTCDHDTGIWVGTFRDLAQDSNVSVSTVHHAVNLLQAEHTLNASPNGKNTTIRILKWNQYQRKTEHPTEHKPNKLHYIASKERKNISQIETFEILKDKAFIEGLEENFRNINVSRHLGVAYDWILAKGKQRAYKDWRAFARNWLRRAQDGK